MLLKWTCLGVLFRGAQGVKEVLASISCGTRFCVNERANLGRKNLSCKVCRPVVLRSRGGGSRSCIQIFKLRQDVNLSCGNDGTTADMYLYCGFARVETARPSRRGRYSHIHLCGWRGQLSPWVRKSPRIFLERRFACHELVTHE